MKTKRKTEGLSKDFFYFGGGFYIRALKIFLKSAKMNQELKDKY
jgi:hypothetical protein